MKLLVYASKIAAFTGFNRYDSPEKKALEIFKTYNMSKYITAMYRNNLIKEEEEAISTVIDKENNENSHLKQNAITGTIDDINTYIENMSNKLSELNIVDITPTINELKSSIYCARGSINEEPDLTKLMSEKKYIPIPHNNKYYLDIRVNGDIISIVGTIDTLAKDEAGEFIIETKRRQNRLFDTVPLYEKIQCIAYMKLLKMDRCLLVQHYQNDYTEHWIDIDNDLWDEIICRLTKFIKFMKILVADETIQDKLVRSESCITY